MLSRRIKGLASEGIACFYLQLHGLQLRTKNFRTKFGEIDLVMTDEDTLVFIEVRLRLTKGWTSAWDSVDIHKQKKIATCAKTYLSKFSWYGDCRFDVVGIGRWWKPVWIRDAFSDPWYE